MKTFSVVLHIPAQDTADAQVIGLATTRFVVEHMTWRSVTHSVSLGPRSEEYDSILLNVSIETLDRTKMSASSRAAGLSFAAP